MRAGPSLLEIITAKDTEAIGRVIVPWDPIKHPLSWVEKNYGSFFYPAFFYEPEIEIRSMRQLRPCEFIFDAKNEFFVEQGGMILLSDETKDIPSGVLTDEQAARLREHGDKLNNAHLYRLEETVLNSKPSKPLIVVGLIPETIKKYQVPAAYVYGEAGRIKPGFYYEINGTLPISTDMPILYFTKRHRYITPEQKHFTRSGVEFFVPCSLAITSKASMEELLIGSRRSVSPEWR